MSNNNIICMNEMSTSEYVLYQLYCETSSTTSYNLLTLPSDFLTSISPSLFMIAIPEESYPLYSNFCNPVSKVGITEHTNVSPNELSFKVMLYFCFLLSSSDCFLFFLSLFSILSFSVGLAAAF